MVEIKVRENGPYKVTGPVRLIDADGNEFELPDDGKTIVLCRCGGSKIKPLCDEPHSDSGFRAAERAVAESDADYSLLERQHAGLVRGNPGGDDPDFVHLVG